MTANLHHFDRDFDKLKVIFANIPAFIFFKDTENRFLRVNEYLANTIGMTCEEIEGLSIYDIYPKEQADSFYEDDKDVIESRKPKEGIVEPVTDLNTGKPGWYRTYKMPYFNDKGSVTGILGFAVDVTDLKETTDELEKADIREKFAVKILRILNQDLKQKEQIREILTNIKEYTGVEAVGIRLKDGDDYPYYQVNGFDNKFAQDEMYLCIKDKGGKVIRDREGCAVLECMCGNVIRGRTDPSLPFFTEGGSFWTNNTTEFLKSTSEEDRQSKTRNRCNGEGYESVALIPLRSGEEVIGLLQLNDLHSDMYVESMIEFFESIGASIGIALRRQEVSDKLEEMNKTLEDRVNERTEELEHERDRFKRVFNLAAEAIVIVYKEGKVYEVNKVMGEILDLDLSEIQNSSLVDFIIEPIRQEFNDALTSCAVEGKPLHNFKTKMTKKDGSVVPLVINASQFPKNGDSEPKALLLITDITEREEAEERAIRNETLAVAGTLAAGVAHEFNNIHGIMKGNLDLIQSKQKSLPLDTQKKLSVMAEMVERAADITTNLLMFTTNTKNAMEIVLLSEVVEGSLKLIEKEFRSSGVKIYRGNFPKDVRVNINRSQIAQVLMNLYINAAHSTLDSPRRQIMIDMERMDGNRVAVRVSDTGCGICEEDIPRLFNPFFTTKGEHARDESPMSQVRGTGLGLSVSHTIMQKHEGELRVESKEGSGSTFSVILDTVEEQIENVPVAPEIKRGNGAKVLILDDEVGIAEVVQEGIQDSGYRTFVTDDGYSALEICKSERPDVVIVDLLMPNMSGEVFFQKLKDIEGYNPYKIVLTGHPLSEIIKRLDIDDVIRKPFKIEDILFAIQNALELE